jgi:hypothetical protein
MSHNVYLFDYYYWYWEHVHAYSSHGVSYFPVPHPLMEWWDERNANLRMDAYQADNIDGGVVTSCNYVSCLLPYISITYI